MKSRVILSICISLLFAGLVSANNTQWTGTINELWSNPDNWSNGLPDPVPEDQARIMLPDTMCLLDIPAEVSRTNVGGYLRLVEGAELTTNDWTILAFQAANEGLMEVLGGVINANARIFVGNYGSATLIVDYDGIINQSGQWLGLGNQTGGQGRIEVRGGLINISSGVADSLRFATGSGSSASMDFSGGTLMQPYMDSRLAYINDHIANGTITAYGKEDGVDGYRVIVDTGENNEYIQVRGLHPFNPEPADGSNVSNGPMTLEWTVAAGTEVDVWFSDDADKILAGDPDAQVVNKQVLTLFEVMTEKDKRYFWAVDTYAPGATDPNYGQIFDFLAENLAPEVDAGDDVTTWVTDGVVDVTLAGTVIDNDPTTTIWTIVSQPDDPNSPQATIADPEVLDTTITCSALGEYVLQLEANDGEKTSTDTMAINVYSTPCEASQSLPEWELTPGDLNGDCIVDDLDRAILMENWGKCSSLECTEPNNL